MISLRPWFDIPFTLWEQVALVVVRVACRVISGENLLICLSRPDQDLHQIIVLIYDTLDYKFWIENNFTKYLKESCWLSSD